jgi:mannose-6-phosphate isomerase-like protein (cupin superfamily)
MEIRRVVTGFDDRGHDNFESDAAVPVVDWRSGNSMHGLWYLDAPPDSPMAGHAFEDTFELEAPVGGATWRIFRTIPSASGASVSAEAAAAGDPRYDKDRPGFHRTDTIDFVRILEGTARLELDDVSVELVPGDCVVQRGTWHNWELAPDVPLVFSAVMLRCDPAVPTVARTGLGVPYGPDPSGYRRIVTEVGDDGRSRLATVGPPATTQTYPNGTTMSEIWQTFGPLGDPMQGGDVPDGVVRIPPADAGTTWRLVTLPPQSGAATDRDADGRDTMMHRTDTVDFVQIAHGRVVLELPDGSVELGPGDCVIQRGSWHAWRVPFDEPCTMSVVMITTPALPSGLGTWQ